MFSCIKSRDRNELLTLRDVYLRENDKLHATLVLDHFLRNVTGTTLSGPEDLLRYLEACLQYVKFVGSLWEVPHTKPKVQKLLGFIPIPNTTEYEIDGNSVLFSYATKHSLYRRKTEDGVVVHEVDIPSLIKDSLRNYLAEHFRSRSEEIWSASRRFLSMPCPNHATRGSCRRTNCQQEHIDARKLDCKWFNLRIRIHYLQIIHLQTVEFALSSSDRRHWRGYALILH